jgi:exonuclease III
MFVANVAAWCEQIHIAGSLRRLEDDVAPEATVGDIEIVAMPLDRAALIARLGQVSDTRPAGKDRMRKLIEQSFKDWTKTVEGIAG